MSKCDYKSNNNEKSKCKKDSLCCVDCDLIKKCKHVCIHIDNEISKENQIEIVEQCEYYDRKENLQAKIISFPKNKQILEIERQRKLKVAFELLEWISQENADFHIVVDKNVGLNMFQNSPNDLKDYIILTTNPDEARKMQLRLTQMRNSEIYTIKGDELDQT